MSLEDLAAHLRTVTEDMVAFFYLNAPVSVELEENTIRITVDADNPNILIGYRGETLRALEQLLYAVVRDKTDERVYLKLDISGYREARTERMIERARKAAKQATDIGKEVVLPPMTPAERRAVHMALKEDETVETESRGEGKLRRLVVKPRS